MAAVSLDLDPGRKVLYQFGFIALVAFGLLAGLVLWKGGLFGFEFGAATEPVAWAMIGLGVVSGIFSLVKPEANKPLFLGLTIVTYPIGFVLSYVIMGFIFYGLITPLGLFFRLVGRDRLNLKLDPEAESYWTERQPPPGADRYFKQF